MSRLVFERARTGKWFSTRVRLREGEIRVDAYLPEDYLTPDVFVHRRRACVRLTPVESRAELEAMLDA